MGFGILAAIWLIGSAMQTLPAWRGWVGYCRATALAGAGLAAVTVAMAETEQVGLLERLLTWSYLQWYVVVGAAVAAGRMTGQEATG